jgi:hypothetical protein
MSKVKIKGQKERAKYAAIFKHLFFVRSCDESKEQAIAKNVTLCIKIVKKLRKHCESIDNCNLQKTPKTHAPFVKKCRQS